MGMLHNLGMEKKDFLTQPSLAQFSTPKRGSGFQTFRSTHEPLPSPGPDRPFPGKIGLNDVTWESSTSPDRGFAGLSTPKLASPSPCKRERDAVNFTTADKKIKVRAVNILHTDISLKLALSVLTNPAEESLLYHG